MKRVNIELLMTDEEIVDLNDWLAEKDRNLDDLAFTWLMDAIAS